MTIEPPTLTRRSFLSAAAAGIVSGPIWAKAITASLASADSQRGKVVKRKADRI